MSTTALTAATNLLDRVRDSGGIGLSSTYPPTLAGGKAYAYTILSQAQRYINCIEQNQISVISFTTTPYQTTYPISSDPILGTPSGSSPIIKVIGIRDGSKDLVHIPLEQLAYSDLNWFRATGNYPVSWSEYGRDVFIIHPAPPRAYLLNIVAIPYLADLVNDGDLFTVTDDLIPQVLDLAEAIALFKLGEYNLMAPPLERLSARYRSELTGDAWRSQMSSLQ